MPWLQECLAAFYGYSFLVIYINLELIAKRNYPPSNRVMRLGKTYFNR